MHANKRHQVPYEHPHSGFQKLQTKQVEMRVTEPSVPPERAGPQSEERHIQLNKRMFMNQIYICTNMGNFVCGY